ncbi:MAG: FMN-binding protein [Desulfocapsaceae bacterium]|nr:FMN-binding protein [Desulfocapsaceae bacterium]
MKNIITIIIRLTLSCLLAAFVMGIFFVMTSKAKKHNEHVNEEKVMYSLLGYKVGAPVPETVKLYAVYRYIVTDPAGKSIGYLVPTGQGAETGFSFIILDLDGKLIEQKPVTVTADDAAEAESRDKAIKAALGAGKEAVYADDKTIIVTDNGARTAYLLSGKFAGFKASISVMLALKTDFGIRGLAIVEHEEDPGLGAEIEKGYFKNQFIGKSFATLKTLDVVKEPLPDAYAKAMEGVKGEDGGKILEQYKDHAIYALTGATISSRAVTNGVKGTVAKFAYRINILDNVLKEQHIVVPF